MAKMGSINYDQLRDYHAACEALGKNSNELYIAALQEAGNVALAYLRKNTARVTGRLGDAWQVSKVLKKNGSFYIVISNPVEYASFYEYGHFQEAGRYVPTIGKRLKKGWVQGRFVLKRAIRFTEDQLDSILQKHLDRRLKELFE